MFYVPEELIKLHPEDRDLVLLLLETVCTTILMLISTWWVNRKAVSHQTVDNGEFNKLRLASKSIASDNKENEQLSMDKTLSHFQGYSLFMEYLLEELSIENMLFVTEIVHLKHLFHKLQRKKRKLENKGKKKRLRVSMQSRRKSTHSSKHESEELKYDEDYLEVGTIGSTPKNMRFTLSVTNSDYETDAESGDELDSPSNDRNRADTNNSDNGVSPAALDDESPGFFDTNSTKPMPMNTARSRDTETHQKNDW
eukprot:CAMPEP_0201585358 /NCGR_PEP_ID=MMETSP0190_2-20130828/120856_1 /ASSEMBLY_ACC=CAM_ASM_000263 /TAXON_ID=37353 /ORGANISM="Rosalina sp." /LENGTH=253 /DNA_ID=CAMNT_0048031129 /DNA_START=619 /DNA_END=1377 /DNA_ORIENTATION=-